MKYPDGRRIFCGDIIWWNEGSNVGRVAVIVETEDERLQWGLLEYGIFICANVANDELSRDVFCPRSDFEDESIGLYEEDSTGTDAGM